MINLHNLNEKKFYLANSSNKLLNTLKLSEKKIIKKEKFLVKIENKQSSNEVEKNVIKEFLFPDYDKLPEDAEMSIWEHMDELRERVAIAGVAGALAILGSFFFSKEIVIFLEAPVIEQGVRFLQLSPGEYFFTTIKVSGYTGLLLSMPTITYQIGTWVRPGLTSDEKKFLAPIFISSTVLFLVGVIFSYKVLAPGALSFFVNYAAGAVESIWSIDQYFEFILVLMLGTGLSFQVPVVQLMVGQIGIVSSAQMLSVWRYIVVGATLLAAVLTPSTDPFTQILLAGPLTGLYFGGVLAVRLLEQNKLKS
jgi:sec-independent protein translocase protein TatC